MTSQPSSQTAVVQSKKGSVESRLPLVVARSRPMPPDLPTAHHVLVRVLAVGLNPTDFKMVAHFFMEDGAVGCDFCGVVVAAGAESAHPVGARVAGADFPYRPDNPHNGAFSEYLVVDSRHVLKIPTSMTSTQAAGLGAIGWGTAALAISDPEALNLPALPSSPTEKQTPVLVYGGATATGIMAIQMLKLWVVFPPFLPIPCLTSLRVARALTRQVATPSSSGYAPIAVCSARSAPLVTKLGAVGTASYTSPTCSGEIRELAGGVPIKHALDCITDAESAAVCFASLARVGSRYACLEAIPDAWVTRKSVALKVVMGFEGQDRDVDLGHPVYSRKANPALHRVVARWARELQAVLDEDESSLVTQPVREVEGGFEGVIEALEMLQRGEIKGQKLVVAISD